jgi:hypothetical protein
MMLWKSFRAALITLICGWGVALLFAAGFALPQYQELARSLPPDQVAAAFQARIDRELWRGSLLLYVQVGVLCGVLWWIVARSGVNGLLTGALVAGAQMLLARRMESSLLFWIPLGVVIVAVGAFSAHSRSAQRQSPGTSSGEPPRP